VLGIPRYERFGLDVEKKVKNRHEDRGIHGDCGTQLDILSLLTMH
jgi:hypothetical protein